jgi:putative phage-type endonuclease
VTKVRFSSCEDLGVRAGSKRWAALRDTGIGASEIAGALGIAPAAWTSPMSLYLRKRGELPDVRDNSRMEWGRLLEGAILQRFLQCHPEFRDGPTLTGRLYRSKTRPWQLATPDAVVFDRRQGFAYDRHVSFRTSEGRPVVVEIKTGSSKEGWGEDRSDEVPVYYRAQVLQSMDVVGASVAWMPVLFNGREYREYRIEYHKRDVEIIRKRGDQFWRMVQDGTPPTLDGLEATTRAMRIAWGVEEDKTAQVTREVVERINRAKALEKRVKAMRDRYENELRALMEDADQALVGPVLVAKRSTYLQSVVNLDALREEHPELIEKHTTQEPRQRLTVYKKDIP